MSKIYQDVNWTQCFLYALILKAILCGENCFHFIGKGTVDHRHGVTHSRQRVSIETPGCLPQNGNVLHYAKDS